MSKKNKNNYGQNEEIMKPEEVLSNENEVQVEDAAVNEGAVEIPETIEAVEDSVDTNEVATENADIAETVEEEQPTSNEPEVNEAEEPVSEIENTPEESMNDNGGEVNPLPEINGNIYISLGVETREEKVAVIEERMAKTGFHYITTATGEALVGPFSTNEDAIRAKKVILGKGLRGTIKNFK